MCDGSIARGTASTFKERTVSQQMTLISKSAANNNFTIEVISVSLIMISRFNSRSRMVKREDIGGACYPTD